jgi:hypothetical protein
MYILLPVNSPIFLEVPGVYTPCPSTLCNCQVTSSNPRVKHLALDKCRMTSGCLNVIMVAPISTKSIKRITGNWEVGFVEWQGATEEE